MTHSVRYIVVTPVRNEERYFPHTVNSLVSQTICPAMWVVVDDGSTDRTGKIADAAAEDHAWVRVVHRPDRGFREPGTGVVAAFYDGLTLAELDGAEFIVKLDGDLVFPPDFFERCFAHFEESPRLGIGGGLICQGEDGALAIDSAGDPSFHVRGATKIYRRACWEEIGGLIPAPGWDTVDELKANMLGWTTRTFNELPVHQLKATGSADGSWRNWVKNGRANYVTGYHPAFMLCKCLKRLIERPFGVAGVGLFFGFVSGYFGAASRLEDKELIRFLRREQFRKLTLRRSLWTAEQK
ncbi:MAG: glycosyltransferase family 2 protein [Pyrinomonadaceae bacterium]|nr:glycosyltransferase family 2 protein [Pyrinomonadaceae bacterium]